MREDVVERKPNVRELLGLTPVDHSIATTSRHLIYPLSDTDGIPVSSGTPFYYDGGAATRAILLLRGAAIISLPHLTRDFLSRELVAAPALIGEDALSGGIHNGTARAFTDGDFQDVYLSNIWNVYTNPTDARTLVLAQANRTIGLRAWASLIGEQVPQRIDFLFRYLSALATEFPIPYLDQDDLAVLVGGSRESVNKAFKDPDRRNVFKELKPRFLPRDPKGSIVAA